MIERNIERVRGKVIEFENAEFNVGTRQNDGKDAAHQPGIEVVVVVAVVVVIVVDDDVAIVVVENDDVVVVVCIVVVVVVVADDGDMSTVAGM